VVLTVHDIVARLSDDPGRDMDAHLAVLYSIARFLPARLVLEIGCDDGSSTLPLLIAVAENGGELFSIDPAACERAKLVVAQSGYADRWHFTQAKSADVAHEVPDASLDVVLIDGDHGAEGVASDWHLYAPKVRVGGFVLFHDKENRRDFPGIAALIDGTIRHDINWEQMTLPYGHGLTLCRRLA
jgi:predicted O-methyltransferase YrrM